MGANSFLFEKIHFQMECDVQESKQEVMKVDSLANNDFKSTKLPSYEVTFKMYTSALMDNDSASEGKIKEKKNRNR